MTRVLQFLTFVAASMFAAGVATAGDTDMVIVQSHGTPLPAGAVIDGSKEVELSPGAEIVLVSQSGGQVTLSGPFKGEPISAVDGAGSGGGVVDALAGLLAKSKHSTASLGAVRGGDAKGEIPDPWAIDVTEDGSACTMPGSQSILWRGAPGKKTTFVLSEEDGVWRGKVSWPANRGQLKMPKTFEFKDGALYGARFKGSEKRLIKVRTVPADLATDAARAAWMSENGCEKQALALLKAM